MMMSQQTKRLLQWLTLTEHEFVAPRKDGRLACLLHVRKQLIFCHLDLPTIALKCDWNVHQATYGIICHLLCSFMRILQFLR